MNRIQIRGMIARGAQQRTPLHLHGYEITTDRDTGDFETQTYRVRAGAEVLGDYLTLDQATDLIWRRGPHKTA